MAELENLTIGEVSDITSSSERKFKEKLEDLNPTINDIDALREAEHSGKGRSKLISFLKEIKKSKKIENELKIAKKDSKELEQIADNIDDIEDLNHLKEEKININQDQLIELVGGTVKEMKKFVREEPLTSDQLQNILDAEKKVKNRKTAKSFLRNKLKRKRISRDVENAKKEISKLRSNVEDIEEVEANSLSKTGDLESSTKGEDIEKLAELTEETSDESHNNAEGKNNDEEKSSDAISENQIDDDKNTEKLNEETTLENTKSELEDEVEKLEKEVDKNSEEGVKIDEKKLAKALKELEDDSKRNNTSGSENVSKEREEVLDDKDTENKEESSKETSEEQEYDAEAVEEESDETEEEQTEEEQTEEEQTEELKKRKENIREELGLDIKDEELEEMSIDELENLSDEKTHREELITELVKEDGMEPETLRKASTSDLEKLTQKSLSTNNQDSEEMRQEAEEDLEMLMGAVRGRNKKENNENSGGPREKVEDIKEQLKDLIDRSSDDEDADQPESIDPEEVKELLRDYRSLSREEAAIKTAHVMKGFLEEKLGINREMTYKELAKEMPKESQEMEKLSDFFLKMHREQYTGKIEISSTQTFMQICKDALNKF